VTEPQVPGKKPFLYVVVCAAGLALASVRLRPAVPATQGLGADAELPGDSSDRLARRIDERDRIPLELLGVPLRVLASHLVLLLWNLTIPVSGCPRSRGSFK
jgi:hypothetical protein